MLSDICLALVQALAALAAALGGSYCAVRSGRALADCRDRQALTFFILAALLLALAALGFGPPA